MNLSKSNLMLLALLLFCVCRVGYGGKIIYPWRATTAIVKAGKSFEVWFDTDEGQEIKSVELQGPYSKALTSVDAVKGSWLYDKLSGNTYNTLITVNVPADTPADRYSLLLHTTSGDEISMGAVKVIKAYRDQYYVLQFSDVHRWQGGYDGMHTMRKVSEILKIANIIDPEIIIETGDNMYNVRNHPEREASYFHGFPEIGILGMHDTPAATFMVAGNHDSPNNNYKIDKGLSETADFYNTYYGLHSYNFTYGNGRFCIFNNGWGAQATDTPGQAKNADEWLERVGRGNFILGAAHIMDGEYLPFYRVLKVNLAIAGHNHYLARENPRSLEGDPVLYLADSVRDKGNFEFNLFQIDNLTGDCSPVSGLDGRCRVIQGATPELIADPEQWGPNLERTFEKENNGSSEVNTATIVNRYDFPIIGAKVRFLVPKGAPYTVSQGVVEQAFDGESVHVVDVRIPIGANSTNTIEIAFSYHP